MSKHKSEDYKITAVKYYLENDTNYTKTCKIFMRSNEQTLNIFLLSKIGILNFQGCKSIIDC